MLDLSAGDVVFEGAVDEYLTLYVDEYDGTQHLNYHTGIQIRDIMQRNTYINRKEIKHELGDLSRAS